MTKKIYTLLPEHKDRLPEWRDRWIANAMSTDPMTDEDRRICTRAVNGMYATAGLTPPRVVFVPSPFVLRFAGGFSAAIWHLRKTGRATYEATAQATDEAARAKGQATAQATEEAADEATRQATWEAAWQATAQATRQATNEATAQATRQATWQATDEATRQAGDEATRQATRHATYEATAQATARATRQATYEATYEATRQATARATRQATYEATYEATAQAADEATAQATYEATAQAADEATYEATEDKKWFVTGCDFRELAYDIGVGELGLKCAEYMYRVWQGGNQWPGYDSYLSFFQDVVALDLPEYNAYTNWRALAEHSGPRIVHAEFCMISDRPDIFTVDERNRPHNDHGPFCRWRDGAALYAIHGVYMPAWIVLRPETITIKDIAGEANSEIQRVMIERFGGAADPADGWARYMEAVNPEIVDHDDRWGTLIRAPGGLALRVVNRSPEPDGTFRQYVLAVSDGCEPLPDPADPGGELGSPQTLTALNAVASTFGLTGREYAKMLTSES